MDELRLLTIAVVAAPLLGAIFIALFRKQLSNTVTHWWACSNMAIACGLSLYIFIGFLNGKYTALDTNIYSWATSGSLDIAVGFLIDRLSALMLVVVTFVSLMVHVYSIGYMRDDPGYKRFFIYILLFTFSMLMLIMSNNFVQLFFGWEAVGLLSYLLIGFWYKKPTANCASLKAFIINRIGDVGFIIGIAAVLCYFDSLHYKTVFAQIPKFVIKQPIMHILPNVDWQVISVICISLFIGAMAKSAQMPLHVWLPDSMEGPTPISALIHAATMVTAGIFMVARMSPLFEYSVAALSLMLVIGSITCLFTALLALVQVDIKRIIAYSTLSQLGYMVAALGISAYSAAIFHLFTHAFFKALLFLSAGSVILAMHHEQNIFNMGNLKKYMPITMSMMLVGTIALIGFPGTAGFYSKDLIINATKYSNLPFAPIAYYMILFTVLVTTVYSFRLLFLVFFTQERESTSMLKGLHEPGKVILVPLIWLAIPSIIIGGIMIGSILDNFLQDSIFVLPSQNSLQNFKNGQYSGPIAMLWHGFFAWQFLLLLLGFAIAWCCYIRYPSLLATIHNYSQFANKILTSKYGFDLLNEKVIVPTVRMIGAFCWRVVDIACIERVLVNGTANSIVRVAVNLRRMQTGYLHNYIFIMIVGLLILLLWTFYL